MTEDERKTRKREHTAKYDRSAKGKARRSAWATSDVGKASSRKRIETYWRKRCGLDAAVAECQRLLAVPVEDGRELYLLGMREAAQMILSKLGAKPDLEKEITG